MDVLFQAIQGQLLEILSTVLVACVGVVTTYATKFLKQKGLLAKLEHNKGIVKIVVNSVEQIATELNGEAKFELAKAQLVEGLAKKKVKITEEELDQLIEAMVKEMKDTINATK